MTMESRKWIRSIGKEGRIKGSDVERISRNIADRKGNRDFYISHSTLADIERGGSIPSIHKLFSLAICLKASLTDLLLPFGIGPEELPQSQAEFNWSEAERRSSRSCPDGRGTCTDGGVIFQPAK